MAKMTNKQLEEWLRKDACGEGRTALVLAHKTIEDALRKLERQIAEYDESTTALTKAKVINRTIMELYSFIPMNLRIDLLAEAQANLTKYHGPQSEE